jgi:hypothetical protein
MSFGKKPLRAAEHWLLAVGQSLVDAVHAQRFWRATRHWTRTSVPILQPEAVATRPSTIQRRISLEISFLRHTMMAVSSQGCRPA